MRWLKQVMRGCGTLPHVGSHPGFEGAVGMLVVGGVFGAEDGGWRGVLGGVLLAAIFVVPLYLIGAYDRANESDRLSKR